MLPRDFVTDILKDLIPLEILKFTAFKFCEKSTLRNKLLSSGIKANALGTKRVDDYAKDGGSGMVCPSCSFLP